MRRGTTPKHTFTLPFDTSDIKKVHVIYAQNDEVVLRKCEEDVSLKGNDIVLKLTQEETLLFDCQKNVKVQIRVLTAAGDALSSDPCLVSVEECLEDEVLA